MAIFRDLDREARARTYLDFRDVYIDICALLRCAAYWLVLFPVNQLAVLAAVPHILTPRAPALASVAAHLQRSCCVEFGTQRFDLSNNVCHSLLFASLITQGGLADVDFSIGLVWGSRFRF